MPEVLIASPVRGALSGSVRVPGDKSISHRAVMLAALAEGTTRIEGFLPGEDTLATARIFSMLGAVIDWQNEAKTKLIVHGTSGMLRAPSGVLDAGNAGTCARLLLGVLAGQPFSATVDGDASLRRRPMRRVTEPLAKMGARFFGATDHLPITIEGRRPLSPIEHRPAVASAQVKSAVLLAGLFASGTTCVIEPRATRDHTERMLPAFGQPVHRDGLRVCLEPTGVLRAPKQVLSIPADPSSAAFFAAAAAIVPGSKLELTGVGINPRRDGWRRILEAMGAKIQTHRLQSCGEEPVADLHIEGASRLRGVQVAPEDVPDAIDEFPVLFAVAALAEGRFELRGASELRVKESDRIATMAEALSRMGAKVQELPDGLRIEGQASLEGGCEVDANHDHRVAMAIAVAAQRARKPVRIVRAAEIATSFPNFVELGQAIGMQLRWEGQ